MHGSYEALLADPDVDAIYNPLPNHLHVPWSIKAAEAGKHVLCEKPIGARRRRGAHAARPCATAPACVIGEAFMVRSHPQWLRAQELVAQRARSATLRVDHGHFSYFNRDPTNIRNMAEYRRRRPDATSAATRSRRRG